MTTIAYKDGVIACDSRATAGDLIATDRAKKIYKRKGLTFVGAGAVCDIQVAFEAWPADGEYTECGWEAFVVDGGELIHAGFDGETLFRIRHDQDEPYAIGSGSPFALTALDMGCTAREAIKMAARRDVGTGGMIKTCKVG